MCEIDPPYNRKLYAIGRLHINTGLHINTEQNQCTAKQKCCWIKLWDTDHELPNLPKPFYCQ